MLNIFVDTEVIDDKSCTILCLIALKWLEDFICFNDPLLWHIQCIWSFLVWLDFLSCTDFVEEVSCITLSCTSHISSHNCVFVVFVKAWSTLAMSFKQKHRMMKEIIISITDSRNSINYILFLETADKIMYKSVFLTNNLSLFGFCMGHFVMVPLNLIYLHCLQHSFFEHLFNLYWNVIWTENCTGTLWHCISWVNIMVLNETLSKVT